MTDAALASKRAQAERRLAYVRAGLVAFNSAVYLFGHLPGTDPRLADAIVVVALSYSVVTLVPPRLAKLPLLRSRYFTTVADSLLIPAWLLATGGAHSPFVGLWSISLVGVALRFDARRTWLTACAYATIHLGMTLAIGQLLAAPLLVLTQLAYVLVIGVTAGFAAQLWLDESRARREATTRMSDARAAERRFRGLLEHSPDPILVADARRRVIVVNGRAEDVFGTSRDALLGNDLAELVAPASRDAFAAWYDAAMPGADAEGGTGRFEGQRAEGTFPLEVFASPYPSEEGRQLVCVVRDITERLAAEEARLVDAERLREIDRLKEIDRFKTQFINMTAHELGTPLTPIRMQVHILQTGDQAGLDPKQRRAVEVIDRNVKRLAALVQDVLDIARAQANRLGVERRPVDLNRLTHEAVESFEETARQNGIRLRATLTPGLTVPADEKRLTQVLFNLLSNAMKFSPPGSDVSVSTSRKEGAAVIVVRDTGIGIPPEDQPRLFKPFSQLQDPSERTRAGSGLGLYISRSIVELHEGRLTLKSEGAGKGSTFTIELPLEATEARAPARTRRLSAPSAALAPRLVHDDLQRRIDELI